MVQNETMNFSLLNKTTIAMMPYIYNGVINEAPFPMSTRHNIHLQTAACSNRHLCHTDIQCGASTLQCSRLPVTGDAG